MPLKALATIEKNVTRIHRRHRNFPVDVAMILRLVKLIDWQVTHSGNALLKTWGVTYEEYGLLTTLYGTEDYALSARELCHIVGQTSGRVNRLIHLLDERGLVVRSYGVTDRRKAVATLSDQGIKLVREVLPVIDAMVSGYVQSFAQGELAELTRLLKKSVKSLA
jgi:MarR family transcriptional regulator, negative regulator of the multidrug operon emrRAB